MERLGFKSNLNHFYMLEELSQAFSWLSPGKNSNTGKPRLSAANPWLSPGSKIERFHSGQAALSAARARLSARPPEK